MKMRSCSSIVLVKIQLIKKEVRRNWCGTVFGKDRSESVSMFSTVSLWKGYAVTAAGGSAGISWPERAPGVLGGAGAISGSGIWISSWRGS